jgi:hypothetical protein
LGLIKIWFAVCNKKRGSIEKHQKNIGNTQMNHEKAFQLFNHFNGRPFSRIIKEYCGPKFDLFEHLAFLKI